MLDTHTAPQLLCNAFSQDSLCCLVSVNLTAARVTREEAISIEEFPPSDWPVGMPVGQVLIDD